MPAPRTPPATLVPPAPPRAPVVPAAPAAPAAARPPRRRWLRSRTGPYLLLLPALVPIAVGLGYPLVRQFVLSFQEYGLAQQFGRPAEWVGLDNYTTLLTDPYVWGVIGRSIAFCLVNAGLTMVVGVALAVLMTRVGRFARTTLQIGLLLAWGTPVLATMTVWQWLFDSQYGVVNWLLAEPLGFEGMRHHSWIIEPLSFYLLATLIVVWMSVPFVVFSVYAGLLQVPEETLQAAELDGAGAWQRLRYISLPLVRPVLLIVGLLQVIWDLRVFTQIYVLQQAGGVTRDTNLLGTYIYRLGIGGGDFGTAAAVAMFMLALTVILTAPYVFTTLKAERE